MDEEQALAPLKMSNPELELVIEREAAITQQKMLAYLTVLILNLRVFNV